jgi:orotate phosphoribosyltransferase
MDMGATPIVGAVACRSHYIGRPMPTFVVRKEVKSHGTQKKIEGHVPPAGGKVVIIDDVITTGDSILKAIDAAKEAGCEILLAISVLDRGAGAAESLAARGVLYRPLVTLGDLGITA